MTTSFSPGSDHVSSGWCLHSGTKTRSSFSLTASAAQGSLHTLLLLGDFYKKLQSAIVSLQEPKMINKKLLILWSTVNASELAINN
jgi:hypothetical protein